MGPRGAHGGGPWGAQGHGAPWGAQGHGAPWGAQGHGPQGPGGQGPPGAIFADYLIAPEQKIVKKHVF